MSQMKILVIDDEQGIRDGCERILKRMKFDVRTASRGDEGLKILAEAPIPIVLLDLKMPGMDGLEVLDRIRERYPSIVVIIITGFATIETAIQAMKQGAYDFVPKPFEPDHLRIVVERARENITLTLEARKLAAERRKTLLDLDTEKSRMRTILESLPNALVVTNVEGRVVLMNPVFMQFFGIDPCQPTGEPIENYVSDEGLCRLIRDISAGSHPNGAEPPSHELELPGGVYLMARGKPVVGEEGECLGAVITLANITTMKVLDQMKSEFVAKVSHELRSPLSTIHEQIALVLSDMPAADDDRDHHLLERAKEKTRGLISMIGDMLDLTRIECGAVIREPVVVRVDEMLENIVDFLDARAKSKGQSLAIELPPEPPPPLLADPMALESIFGNLITNAINYTPEGGSISVVVHPAAETIRVDVSDNGFGIAEKDLERIFERFYRVKNARTRNIVGTGLGLPIVKSLVESLAGTIQVESEVDVGTTFIVRLPVDRKEATECVDGKLINA